MRKWEGKADTHMSAALQDFVKRQYPKVDASRVRWGFVGDMPSSTCITDCYDIYCDKVWVLDDIKGGAVGSSLIFHELTHVEQCVARAQPSGTNRAPRSLPRAIFLGTAFKKGNAFKWPLSWRDRIRRRR